MTPVLAILIYFAVSIFVANRCGLVSSEFLFLTFLSVFHIPFTIIYLLGYETSEGIGILSLIDIDTELLTAVPFDIAMVVIGVFIGSSLKTKFQRSTALQYQPAAFFRPALAFFFVGTMTIVTLRFFYVRSNGYSDAGNFALIDPVVDWLIRGFYLVLFAYVMEFNKWQVSSKQWILFLPFLVAMIGGSRQAAFGPIMAVVVLNSIMLNLSVSRIMRNVLLLGVIAALFPLIRALRVTEGENLNWDNFGGVLGIFIETGRPVRLLQWAHDTCSEPIGIGAYLSEALVRLVPFTKKDIQNLSTEVYGGGNAFSALAEAHCVSGDDNVLWLLLVGALWGFFLSFRRADLGTPQGRLKLFLTIALAITWPRDELLGYVRELIWVSFLIPILVNTFLVRSVGLHTTSLDTLRPTNPTSGRA